MVGYQIKVNDSKKYVIRGQFDLKKPLLKSFEHSGKLAHLYNICLMKKLHFLENVRKKLGKKVRKKKVYDNFLGIFF
jgi:hypothetical protein